MAEGDVLAHYADNPKLFHRLRPKHLIIPKRAVVLYAFFKSLKSTNCPCLGDLYHISSARGNTDLRSRQSANVHPDFRRAGALRHVNPKQRYEDVRALVGPPTRRIICTSTKRRRCSSRCEALAMIKGLTLFYQQGRSACMKCDACFGRRIFRMPLNCAVQFGQRELC